MQDSDTVEKDNRRLQECARYVDKLREWIDAVDGIPDGDTKWLVSSLLKSALRSYNHLQSGWKTDSTYTAWACRTLFELRVITKYVSTSPVERQRFIHHFLVDMEQSIGAQKEMALKIDPESVTEHDELVGTIAEWKDQRKFSETSFLKLEKLAESVGLLEDFKIVNKLCSKLAHATAQSVLSIDMESTRLQDDRDAHMLLGWQIMRNYLSRSV